MFSVPEMFVIDGREPRNKTGIVGEIKTVCRGELPEGAWRIEEPVAIVLPVSNVIAECRRYEVAQ